MGALVGALMGALVRTLAGLEALLRAWGLLELLEELEIMEPKVFSHQLANVKPLAMAGKSTSNCKTQIEQGGV